MLQCVQNIPHKEGMYAMSDPASDCSDAFLDIPGIMCDWVTATSDEEGRSKAQEMANEKGGAIILLRNTDGLFYFSLVGSGGFERVRKHTAMIDFNFTQVGIYGPAR